MHKNYESLIVRLRSTLTVTTLLGKKSPPLHKPLLVKIPPK